MRLLAVFAAAVVACAMASDDALAAPWCGSTTTEDRRAADPGHAIRVVYALAADRAERSAHHAPRISADVDEIAAWWRGQDAGREPRFDRVGFPCGMQADIVVVRLGESAAALRADATRFELIANAVLTGSGQNEKHLVYYDGPVEDRSVCGEGGGTATGDGVAIVYLGACPDVPSAVVAAHELLHALGAMELGAPHACPDTPEHPCDSKRDLLSPALAPVNLDAFELDSGRDDYYAHQGAWVDVQQSPWLRSVTGHISLGLVVTGRGGILGAGPACRTVRCARGVPSQLARTLRATPASGWRFAGWSGACRGRAATCTVAVTTATAVRARFVRRAGR